MVKVNYKYVPHGEKLTFQGQEYTKTNHKRGFYHKGGKTIHRYFKPLIVVDTKEELWDFVPRLR